MPKKRIIIFSIIIIAVLIMSFLIGTGFAVRTDVLLTDYSVSEDGTKLTFKTAIPGSMGYIRGFEDKGGGGDPHCITFYSTFGGFNSSFGAKQEFEFDLSEDDVEIYFIRPKGGYELVLKKDTGTGEWERPTGGKT